MTEDILHGTPSPITKDMGTTAIRLCSRELAMPAFANETCQFSIRNIKTTRTFIKLKFPFGSAITYGVVLTSVCTTLLKLHAHVLYSYKI